ncbi:MAG: hypothetical protein KC635_30120, partial [Myxococcales bacterium]|nr:hypothetical protein [Myxococcales bacterium]
MNRLSLWMCAALGLSLLSTAGCRTREIELAARFGHHESTQLLAVAKLEAKGAGGASGEVTLRQLVTPQTKKHDAFPDVRAYLAVDGLAAGQYTLGLHDSSDCSGPVKGQNGRTVAVGADGKGTLIAGLDRSTLEEGDERSILGKSVGLSDGSGAPVACGVIAAVAAP